MSRPLLLARTAALTTLADHTDHLGRGACGMTSMRHTLTSFNASSGGPVVPIARTEALAGGNARIVLSYGAAMVMQVAMPAAMTWFSEQTGDSFTCARLAP